MKLILLTALLAIVTFTNANALTPEMPSPPPIPYTPIKVDFPSGNYILDKTHSSIVFTVSHVGFSNYTMQFKNFDAKLKLDVDKPEKSAIEVTIDPTSLDLPSPPKGFKDTLLGEQWLDVKKFPQITFKSTEIETTGDMAIITGDLTLHGVTKPITLEATFNGGYRGMPNLDPNARAGFSAQGVFNRSDFGVTYGIPEPGTTMGVCDEVTVNIEAEFTGPPMAQKK